MNVVIYLFSLIQACFSFTCFIVQRQSSERIFRLCIGFLLKQFTLCLLHHQDVTSMYRVAQLK